MPALFPSRRAVLMGSAASFLATAARAQDRLDAWLTDHAVRVRTVDMADENFSDLDAIARAIGSARVVALGECSHGGGTGFAAKARLIKFLHQRLGFDLLIWESGLYDVTLADAAMRGPEDGAAAAAQGIFSLWTNARELAPLFTYIKASQAGPKPIAMAGFDIQITATGAGQHFMGELLAFADVLRDPALRHDFTTQADQALGARSRLFATKFANQADLDALNTAADGLAATLTSRRADFEAVHGRIQTQFMARCIENMRADAIQRFDSARTPTDGARESRRDAGNAANLRWLLEERYPGRKAIVWAHNAHVMNAWYAGDFHDVHLTQQPGDMKPTGIFMADWLGDKLYTIGLTAYEGQEGFATGGPVINIAPAPQASLEARLHGLATPFAFVNLRGARDRPPIPVARIPKYESVTLTVPPADIGRIYDGIFFIDRMAPATRA